VDDLVKWIEANRTEQAAHRSAHGLLAQARRRPKTPLPQLHT
jgi:hypothetical protein